VSSLAPLLLALALVCALQAAETPKNTRIVPPEKGVYFGAYLDFGETEDAVTLEQIERFEKLAGKKPAIIASSSYWGEASFPKENLELIARHGAIPIIFWSPWDKPYTQNLGPDKFSLTAILEGKWDAYIDMWANSAKAFGRPFFVSFGNEMNGCWFPWSGSFYGENDTGPETFKKAWRYVVDRTRARGATNISWVFHANNYSAFPDAWCQMARFYPGSDYVNWLGLSVYGIQFGDADTWCLFRPLLDWPYQEISRLDPDKPIMLAEFGVGDFPKLGSKPEWFRDALDQIPKYPRIKAAIYWHERWQNEDGTFSNLRINSSPASLEAFRKGIASPAWLSKPRFAPLPPP